MVDYRTFRNADPPALARLWNECFPGRGAARLRGPLLLEYFSLAKPYFDPEGLVVAAAGGQPVGFAHAGFGPSADRTALDRAAGVTCVLGVAPEHRRRGVGSELLRRAEDYLRRRGARELFAGPMAPLNPFTFGLYGGSQSPGFLDSDPLARPFFEHRGYRIAATTRVFQRPLGRAVTVADGRFPAYRQRFEIHAGPYRRAGWWQECVAGPVELHEFGLVDRDSGQAVARTVVWEMETFSRRTDEHPVGVVELEVVPALRRHGFAKFLLAQLLRHLQDQFFTLVEVHVREDNEPALNLVHGLGFEQVEVGHQFRRDPVAT